MNAEDIVIQISLQDWENMKQEIAQLRQRVYRLEQAQYEPLRQEFRQFFEQEMGNSQREGRAE